jgi:hypothetical protein
VSALISSGRRHVGGLHLGPTLAIEPVPGASEENERILMMPDPGVLHDVRHLYCSAESVSYRIRGNRSDTFIDATLQ